MALYQVRLQILSSPHCRNFCIHSRFWVLKEIVSENVEPEASALLGPEHTFLAKTRLFLSSYVERRLLGQSMWPPAYEGKVFQSLEDETGLLLGPQLTAGSVDAISSSYLPDLS